MKPSSSTDASQRFKQVFHTLIAEEKFIRASYDKMKPHGFTKENTIPCVSLCRDELTAPMLEYIGRTWQGEKSGSHSFIMSSLAGMLFLGKTGLKAALDHAPRDEKGKERFALYAFPHIGINDKGVVGKLKREGIPHDSSCCGALIAFQKELEDGFLHLELDTHDIEQSLLKQRMMKRININHAPPNLVDLTMLVHSTIVEDLEYLIEHNFSHNPRDVDYVVYTGVQIHAKNGNFIWPGPCYAVVNGKRFEVNMSEELESTDVEEVSNFALLEHDVNTTMLQ